MQYVNKGYRAVRLSSRWKIIIASVCGLALSALFTGCQDLTAGSSIPSNVTNPRVFQTAAGAHDLASRAQVEFQSALQNAIVMSGLMSDELTVVNNGGIVLGATGPTESSVDRRDDPNGTSTLVKDTYNGLHKARGYAMYAIAALRRYDSTTSPALLSELFAFQGYTEILLADLFCSGIPLSTIDFEGDYTYAPGSSVADVYRHAVRLFDTAIALVPANDTLRALLARVGKGRALLALGESQAAAGVVADIVLNTAYTFPTRFGGTTGGLFRSQFRYLVVADREAQTGFPYVTGGDPRTAVYQRRETGSVPGLSGYQPTVYQNHWTRTVPITVASGIEAQLILAEAALDRHDYPTWLGLLNALRTTQGLSMLTDPEDSTTRWKTQWEERAMWLFVDGHRQGDLRRRARITHAVVSDLYPSGPYQNTPTSYSPYFSLAIPSTELSNPHFQGCFDRDP